MTTRQWIGFTLLGYSVLFTGLKLFVEATNGDLFAVTIVGAFVLSGMVLFPESSRQRSD